MRRRLVLAALVLVAVGSGCTWTGVPPAGETAARRGWSPARIDSLTARLPALMDRFRVPGVAVVLTRDDEVRWARGFGRTGPGGQVVTPRSVFQVASLGKPVFADLVATLAESREWNLYEPIGEWSPAPLPPEVRATTAERILAHIAGIRYDAEADRVRRDESLYGTWSYSGAGYGALQRALESAEGRSLETLGESLVFGPLGLRSMSWTTPAGAGVATGHDRSGGPLANLEWTEANAASSLHSSALDYARYLVAVAGMGGPEPASWARLTSVRATVDEELDLHWGVGWGLERQGDEHFVAFHWGSNPGFKSFAMVDRERELGLVVLTNGDNGLELVEELVEILDPVLHPLFRFYMLHPDD